MFASDHPLHDMDRVQWPWKGFLCGNCVQVAANDEWSGVETWDPLPLGEVPDGIYVIVACCDPTECDFAEDQRAWLDGGDTPGHVHLPDLDDDDLVDCNGCGKREEGKHPAVGDGRK